MNQEFRCRLLSIIIGLVLPLAMFGQYRSERILTDSIGSDRITEINITHKYGDISITKGTTENIQIRYHIIVNKDSRYNSEEQLDLIETNIVQRGSSLDLDLIINNPENTFFSRMISKVTNKGNSEIEAFLEISIPNDSPIHIQNEFGNITINDWSGDLRCNLKHGDLRVGSNLPKLMLNHSYGKINLKDNEKIIADLKNSRMYAKRIDDFVLNSSGSVFDITEIQKVDVSSKRDEFNIENVSSLKCNLNYSTIRINEVKEDIVLKLKVSDIVISKLTNAEPDIFISQDNSEVEINISNTAFELDANLEGGTFRIPKNLSNLDLTTDLIDEEKNKRIISGTYGLNPKGVITIKGKKGFILFREK